MRAFSKFLSFMVIDYQTSVSGPVLCCSATEKINQIDRQITTNLSPTLNIQALAYVNDLAAGGSEVTANRMVDGLRKMEEQKRFSFGIDKTKVLVVGNKKQRKNHSKVTSRIRQGRLKECEEYKYLGTWFNNKGNMETQIEEMKKR